MLKDKLLVIVIFAIYDYIIISKTLDIKPLAAVH